MSDNDLYNYIIRQKMNSKKIQWTNHCLNRLNQRDILIKDVEVAIKNGKVIETYSDDFPFPSCLILGKASNNQNLHVVCGIGNDKLYIVTAYRPDIVQWDKDMKIRRD